jgi:hypothetical protein
MLETRKILVVAGSSMFIKPRLTSLHSNPHFIIRVINDIGLFSTQELDIQTDGPHEQVDIAQALPAHILRQGLADGNSLHNALLDTNDKSLLLVRAGTNTHSGKELPHVDIVCCGDTGVGGEDVGQQWLDGVEQARVQL